MRLTLQDEKAAVIDSGLLEHTKAPRALGGGKGREKNLRLFGSASHPKSTPSSAPDPPEPGLRLRSQPGDQNPQPGAEAKSKCMHSTWGGAGEVLSSCADRLDVEIPDGQRELRFQTGPPNQAPLCTDRGWGSLPRLQERQQEKLQRQSRSSQQQLLP